MSRRIVLSCGIIMLLFLAGCQGTSFSSSCNLRANENAAVCEVTIDSLSGELERTINVEFISTGASDLPLMVDMTVGSGTVELRYIDADGDAVTEQADSSEALNLVDRIQINGKQSSITFASVGGSAGDITATVTVSAADSESDAD